jgi:hypothetical protein
MAYPRAMVAGDSRLQILDRDPLVPEGGGDKLGDRSSRVPTDTVYVEGLALRRTPIIPRRTSWSSGVSTGMLNSTFVQIPRYRDRVHHLVRHERFHLVPALLFREAREMLGDVAPVMDVEHRPVGASGGVEGDAGAHVRDPRATPRPGR